MTYGQYTGKVNFNEEGISFVIPENWFGQEVDDYFLMRSKHEGGIIALVFHPYKNISELKLNMTAGLKEEGVSLSLVSDLSLNNNQLSGTYEGTLNQQKVKGIAIGILNPYGQGIITFALTSPELYSERIVELGNQVTNSFIFDKNILTASKVTKHLSGYQLTYTKNYSSRTPGGGGYSRDKAINLCKNGTFTFFGSSSLAFGDPNFDPYENSTKGHGTWKFIDENNRVYLSLSYLNNKFQKYHVTYKEKKLFLDGERYYCAYDAECN